MAKKGLKDQKRLQKITQAILLFKLIIIVEMAKKVKKAKKVAEERPSYYIFQADQLLCKDQKGEKGPKRLEDCPSYSIVQSFEERAIKAKKTQQRLFKGCLSVPMGHPG